MSAPSSSLRFLVLPLLAILLASGCTVPGSSHLDRPPKDLAPILDYVTADVLGFTLYDTDPMSPEWRALGQGASYGEQALETLHQPLFGPQDAHLDALTPWIGRLAGSALRQLDIDGRTDTSTLYFADVESRRDLEIFLIDHDWVKAPGGKLGEGLGRDLQLWTNTTGSARAVGFNDKVIVAARTPKALRSLLRSADEYAVPQRKSMSDFAAIAPKRSPVAAVFRFDLIRTQLRRPFEHDPAMLELARWATDSNVLIAVRDGWFGLAPPVKKGDDSVRLIGTAEWIPDLAPDIELEPVDMDVLQRVADSSFAIAFNDVGQHAAELVRAITFGSNQYATEQDVPKSKGRLELLPLLDELDGDSVIGFDRTGRLQMVYTEVPSKQTQRDVQSAVDHIDLPVVVAPGGDGLHITPNRPIASVQGDDRTVSSVVDLGESATPAVAWLRSHDAECGASSLGSITWDEVDKLTLSLEFERGMSTSMACTGPPRVLGLFDASLLATVGQRVESR